MGCVGTCVRQCVFYIVVVSVYSGPWIGCCIQWPMDRLLLQATLLLLLP